jgi:hypothetical protein
MTAANLAAVISVLAARKGFWMWRYYYWGIWVLVGLFLLPFLLKPFLLFVVVPIRTHRKSRHHPRRKYEVADLQMMSQEARQQLEMGLAQFRQEGFEPVGPSLASSSEPGASLVHTLLVNPAGDIGEIFSTARQEQAFIRSQVFVIRSIFADEKQIATASTRSTGTFPRDATVDGVNFRWVKDAHTLCEVHRRRIERLGLVNRARIAPKPGEHESYLHQQSENELKRVAKAGYFYFDATEGVYRQTWKGAFLMAWKLISPIKGWRARRRDREAQRVWRELEMDRWRLRVPAASASQTPGMDSALVSSRVEYEPQLAEGEVHTHSADGTLTLRIGMESRGRFLARQWFYYYAIAAFGFTIVMSHYWRWVYGGALRLTPRGMLIYSFSWLVIAWGTASVIIGALRRHGTVTLIASPRGLTYRNILALRGEGELEREKIGSIHVVVFQIGLRRRTYQLLLSAEMRGKYVLALSKDKKELERMRDLLTEAMGVKEKEQAAAPAPA